ncbi:rod shape-determining protein MreC [Bacillus massiliigorillae]|uniref:rod shape-determining protein MreC n=1 Tax=Bacillus massiliigorillae TaxID=1243664 RepID=UPI0003A77376|nr:rod shape-determining protein MreC [Bacillus massiliigorillae]
MPQFFLNKKLIVLLISIIILVALIGFSLRDKENVSWPEQFVKDTAGFFQQIFHTPTQFVTGVFEDLRDLQNTYEENEKLKARLDEYATLKSKVQDLEKENTELRAINKKTDDLSAFTPIQATVIGRNPDRWQEIVVINKGKLHGVEKNMAVMTAKGLIGKVKSTNQFSSTVQILSTTDPKNRISASILGKDGKPIYGIVKGYNQEKGMLLMELKLTKEGSKEKVAKNTQVVTSGLGGVFPKGLPIGEVEKVEIDQNGLTQTAYVKPFADFYDISHVMVVDPKLDKKKVTAGLKDAENEEGGL